MIFDIEVWWFYLLSICFKCVKGFWVLFGVVSIGNLSLDVLFDEYGEGLCLGLIGLGWMGFVW